MNSPDTITVPILTRVEGEGKLTIRLRNGVVHIVELSIFEPPRLFEAMLAGRPLEDVPDITARICGICPVAYQMSSVHALENALGIAVRPEIRQLRRLMYCGEWIESHALHIYLLNAPDFFGAASGIELSQRFPDQIRRGLQLKKYGNRLLERLGGRAIHPVNARVGGFYRLPSREALASLIPQFEWGLQAAIETVQWVAGFPFDDFEQDYTFVALTHPDEYAMNEGEIQSSDGLRIPVSEFDQHFVEEQVPHSTALHSVTRKERKTYFLGPLARVNLNFHNLSSEARQCAELVELDSRCTNPFKSIIARSIELVHAYQEALTILRSYEPRGCPSIDFQPKAGSGTAATEAPRGLLFHQYQVDCKGKVVSSRIIPPTSQNQRQIESDLLTYLHRITDSQACHDKIARDCERLIRTYDPCISCSTHFLRVKWETC